MWVHVVVFLSQIRYILQDKLAAYFLLICDYHNSKAFTGPFYCEFDVSLEGVALFFLKLQEARIVVSSRGCYIWHISSLLLGFLGGVAL